MPHPDSPTPPAAPQHSDPTTKILIGAVIIAAAGYFAWNQMVQKPAQAVSSIAKTTQDAVKTVAQNPQPAAKTAADVTKSVIGAAVDQAKKIDLKSAIQVGTKVTQQGARIGTDVANEFIGLTPDEEWRYGDQIRAAVLKQMTISTDAAASARVNRLAQPILSQLKRTVGHTYTITVIEEPVMNAFAILGGNVFIFRGVIDEMKTDVALQSVIAHEIGHVELGHCAKGSFAAIRAAEKAGNIAGAIAGKLQQFIVLGYSEDQEFESDVFAYNSQRAMGVPKQDRLQFVRVLDAYAARQGHADDLSRKPDTVGSAIGLEIKKHYRTHPPAAGRVAKLEKLPD